LNATPTPWDSNEHWKKDNLLDALLLSKSYQIRKILVLVTTKEYRSAQTLQIENPGPKRLSEMRDIRKGEN
jgi:hypothetical protein